MLIFSKKPKNTCFWSFWHFLRKIDREFSIKRRAWKQIGAKKSPKNTLFQKAVFWVFFGSFLRPQNDRFWSQKVDFGPAPQKGPFWANSGILDPPQFRGSKIRVLGGKRAPFLAPFSEPKFDIGNVLQKIAIKSDPQKRVYSDFLQYTSDIKFSVKTGPKGAKTGVFGVLLRLICRGPKRVDSGFWGAQKGLKKGIKRV